MDDDPAFKIDSAGDISMPYRTFATGHFTSTNITNGTGWQMTVDAYQNMTYQNNAGHGWGLTVTKAGYYQMFGTSLYDPTGTYIYIGWCVNGSQHHHWHSNHAIASNHDFVSSIVQYCNIGDHITMENSSQALTAQWGSSHSSFWVAKL